MINNLKNRKAFWICVLLFIILGFFYKLLVTWDDNYIFNMDNARDMIEVREMVVLHKLRLIGPTSGVEGFYNGPAWYYIMAIPFILFSGNPYGAVILMIIFWGVGGYFLLKLVERFGIMVMIVMGGLWLGSDYVSLATLYAYNPNPIVLLTPLLVFLLEKYLEKSSMVHAILLGFLSGLFFNFEMAFGIFVPVIIILAIFWTGKKILFRKSTFYLGLSAFFIGVLPQFLFELRHNFFMFRSIVNYLNTSVGNYHSFLDRSAIIGKTYFSVISATFMNWQLLFYLFILFLVFCLINIKQINRTENILAKVVLLFLFIPFIGQIIIPFNVMPWHLGGVAVAAILFMGINIGNIQEIAKKFNFFALILTLLISFYAFANLHIDKYYPTREVWPDAAVANNEIKAIDYVYKYAQGKDFKVYTYLPSVIDYPYQYLFWSYGLKKYGYLPKDYAYLPDKPDYIPNKEKFGNNNHPNASGLIMLIKQPDDIGQRHLWENSFSTFPLVSSSKIGPIEIEVRKDSF